MRACDIQIDTGDDVHPDLEQPEQLIDKDEIVRPPDIEAVLLKHMLSAGVRGAPQKSMEAYKKEKPAVTNESLPARQALPLSLCVLPLPVLLLQDPLLQSVNDQERRCKQTSLSLTNLSRNERSSGRLSSRKKNRWDWETTAWSNEAIATERQTIGTGLGFNDDKYLFNDPLLEPLPPMTQVSAMHSTAEERARNVTNWGRLAICAMLEMTMW
jgi:hypothetical protein